MTTDTKPTQDTGTTDAASRAAGQFSAMLVGRLAIHVVLLGSAVVLPRVLGDGAFGRYAAVLGMVSILEMVSSGGLHVAELKFVPPLWRTDRDEAVRVASSIWSARMVFSVLVGGIAGIWLTLSPSLGGSASVVLAICAWLVARSALEATRHEFLAMGSVSPMVSFELARAVSTLVIVVTVFQRWGLDAVFGALALGHLGLWLLAMLLLRRRSPVSLQFFDVDALRPMLRFGAATSLGMGSAMVQAHIPVYAVANWVSLEDAAPLAVAVQLFVFAQALLIGPWTAVTPLFAELDANREFERMREWTSALIRWSVAGAVVVTFGWAFLGQTVLEILPEGYASVHEAGTIMLLAVVPLTVAGALNRLLYVGGHALAASMNQVAFALATMAGLGVVLVGVSEPTASAVAAVYGFAAAIYAICAYISVVRLRSMWLPVRRTLLLAAAGVVAWPAIVWDAGLVARTGGLLLVTAVFMGVAVLAGLLPVDEIRQIKDRAARASAK